MGYGRSLSRDKQSALKISLLLIGHSFARWLEESVGDEIRATVSATSRDVTIKGIGGLTIDRLARMLPYLNQLSPSVIVIDIATNDVCSRIVIPERFACQVAEVANMFSGVSSVETVVIMPILPRVLTTCRRSMREDFNDARLIVNRKVAAIVAVSPIDEERLQ